MAIPVNNPVNGDDLTAPSITTNVTDKIVAWAAQHEIGGTLASAVRHFADQIDDTALIENVTPSNAPANQHDRNEMHSLMFSDIMGTTGAGAAAKWANLASLTYASIAEVDAALTTGSSATSDGNKYLKRDAQGAGRLTSLGLDVSGTVYGIDIVAPAGYTGGPIRYSLNGVNKFLIASDGSITLLGTIRAGSGGNVITTSAGLLDAAKLSGSIAIGALPALAGDVSMGAGTNNVTVLTVGGVAAGSIGAAVTGVANASTSGAANQLAKYDGSGQLAASKFVGPATDLATGSILAPEKGGTGAGRLNGIVIGHTSGAYTGLLGSTDGQVPQWDGANSQWIVSSIGNATLAPGQITQDKMAPLFYKVNAGNALQVDVAGGTIWNGAQFLDFLGGTSPTLTNTSAITTGNKRVDMLYINSTGVLAWQNGTVTAIANPITFPALPAFAIPVVFTLSYSGTTAIVPSTTNTNTIFYRDARSFFLNPTGQGPSNVASTGVALSIPGTVSGVSGNTEADALKVTAIIAPFGNGALGYGVNVLPSFRANGATGQFAVGVRSQMVRDTGDTGTFQWTSAFYGIAGNFGTDNYAGYFDGGVGITGVSTFPVAPATNESCYRRDLGCWWRWDGTAWRQNAIPSFLLASRPTTNIPDQFRHVSLDDGLTYQWNLGTTSWDLIGAKQITTAPTSATANDMLRGMFGGSLNMGTGVTPVAKSGTTIIQVVGPAAIEINAQWYFNSGTVSSAALSGAAGQRFVFANGGGAGGAFTVVTSTANSPTANQRLIAVVWWDGAAIQDGTLIDTKALLMADTGNVKVIPFRMSYAGSAVALPFSATNVDSRISGTSTVTVYLPRQMWLQGAINYAIGQTSATVYSQVSMRFQTNGGGYSGTKVAQTWAGIYAAYGDQYPCAPFGLLVGPGQVDFQVWGSTNISGGASLYACDGYGIFYAV